MNLNRLYRRFARSQSGTIACVTMPTEYLPTLADCAAWRLAGISGSALDRYEDALIMSAA